MSTKDANTLCGIGIITVKYNWKQDEVIGFWYTSSISSSTKNYVFLFSDDMKLPSWNSYGTEINEIINGKDVVKYKIYKLKDNNNDEIIRNTIVNLFIIGNRDPNEMLEVFGESVLSNSSCTTKEYLNMRMYFKQDTTNMEETDLDILMKEFDNVPVNAPKTVNQLFEELKKCAFVEVR